MSVVELTFRCERLTSHRDGQSREWTAFGQERVMDPLSQEFSPVVVATDAMCPECSNTGVADYQAATVYVIPADESNRESISQIREAIEGAEA
jgi:hypothetical protein